MRLLLTMKSLQNHKMNFEYHGKIQGFVYSFLKNSNFDQLHDKKGYKFFCFSNVFRSKNSDNYHLIISSPNIELINYIYEEIKKIIDKRMLVSIDSLFLVIKVIKIPEKNLKYPLTIITQSPIILRIHVSKYYGKISHTAPYKSILWRSDHPVNLFIDALEDNMKKKYTDFTGKQIKKQIFERYDFKKQVSTKIEQESSKVPIIGSLWEIEFSAAISSDIQKFALDCGLGERNSLGFGFVNPVMRQIS